MSRVLHAIANWLRAQRPVNPRVSAPPAPDPRDSIQRFKQIFNA